MSGDQYDISMCFAHTSSNGAYPNFGNEFDMNAGIPICILQIMNQLS